MAKKGQAPKRDPLAGFFRPVEREGVAELAEARLIDRTLLDPNPFQPRKSFDPDALQELAGSLRQHGLLQPLVVRALGNRFQIVAGERRWRAAQLAGIEQMPCVVREVDDQELEMLTLLENIQRADLDPVDEAHALQALLDRGLSLRDLAARIHKHHEYVAQRLRLIADAAVEQAVRQGIIGPTVAQELVRIEDPLQRQALLARAERGERVRVQDVKRSAAASAQTAATAQARNGRDNVERASNNSTAAPGEFTARPTPAGMEALLSLGTLAVVRLLRERGDLLPHDEVLRALEADLKRVRAELGRRGVLQRRT